MARPVRRVNCTECGDRRKSRAVFEDGGWFCHKCQAKGRGDDHEVVQRAPTPQWEPDIDWLLQRCEQLVGSPADRYLRRRGFAPPYPADLRFARLKHKPSETPEVPCLVAITRISGVAFAAQRTYLDADGSKFGLEPVRMNFGSVAGSYVQLAPTGPVLGISEGTEDALAAMCIHAVPCWAALGASNLAKFKPPRGVQTVLIFADRDNTGIDAARSLRRSLQRDGIACELRLPAAKDWNEQWNRSLIKS